MSRYSGRLPRTYADAEQMLKGRSRRKVLNNTDLMQSAIDGGCIVVLYHDNVIAEFFEDGSRVLSNCGYGTVSTRERLNSMAPAGVGFVQRDYAQQVHVWQGDGTPARVIDGGTVWIDSEGRVSPR